MLTDEDLDDADGAELAVVRPGRLPGHHEYVTTHEYDAVERYRDLGRKSRVPLGEQLLLAGREARRRRDEDEQWRDLGRPEAALLGVQYRGNDSGEARGSWLVRDVPAADWLFAGTGIRPGSRFGEDWGIEIDRTSPDSPKGVQVIAELPDLFGPGFTAQMTYYETRGGAKVFAAGAFTLAGQALEPGVPRVLTNLWARVAKP